MFSNYSSGIHVLDLACGRGKTTAILNFICQHYNEGILYCVDSISELNKMKDRLEMNLVQTGKIFAEDIVTITSEPNARGVLYDYHTHPESLLKKKILLITHIRFFTSMIDFFMIYSQSPNVPYNGDIQALLTRNDLRQWIFFDETPMWIRPFCTIPRSILAAFSEKRNGVWICKSIGEIHDTYNEFIKGTPEDPFKHGTHLDELKKQFVLTMFPRMYETWKSQPKNQDIAIFLRPKDLAIDGVQTHIFFCEGSADLLLSDSPFNFISTQGKKYNAQINFSNKIPILTERGKNFDEKKYKASLEYIIGIIIDNMSARKKTLVCVWKNKDSSEADIDGTNNSQFRDKVINDLLDYGKNYGYDIEGYFDVIYYGENKCKSCNEYSDCSTIILFGKWFVPDSKCSEHNLNWGTNITPQKLYLWFYVQLISRIGIRRHDGGMYDVYMTDDFPDEFKKNLDNYFNRDQLPEVIQKSTEELDDRLQGRHLYPVTKERIKILCATHPELKNHILNPDNDSTLELYVTDEELKEILSYEGRHFDRSKRDFGKALKHINVNLNSAPNLCP